MRGNNRIAYSGIGLFFMTCVVLGACSPKQDTIRWDTTYNYDEIAVTMCDCSSDLFTMYDEIKSLSEEEKDKRKKELKMKLGETSQKAEDCLDAYLEKNKLDKTTMSREYFDVALKQKCSKLYYVLKIGRLGV